MSDAKIADHIVFIVHYYPPINSSGAKRVEALSKFLVRSGRKVTVITTRKSAADGEFTEVFPPGVEVLQLDWYGRDGESVEGSCNYEPRYTGKPSLKRRIKDFVARWLGQLPDPRLPFAFSFLSPVLDEKVRRVFKTADVVVGSCPPWPMLLAAFFVRWRFGTPCVLDYRDQFSDCHEMPGSPFAKAVERFIDSALATKANAVVTISEPMRTYYAGFNSRVSAIMNGYDPEALENAVRSVPVRSLDDPDTLVVRYLGKVSPGRVPRNFLAALMKLQQTGKVRESSIRFEYYGSCAIMENALKTDYPMLVPFFVFKPAVPYQESLQLMASADYLLFSETSSKATLSAQGILTTKLFEYLGSGRKVIADIDPDSLAGGVIRKASEQHLVSKNAEDFEKYLQDAQFWTPVTIVPSPFVKTLSRAYQADQYQLFLDSLCAEMQSGGKLELVSK